MNPDQLLPLLKAAPSIKAKQVLLHDCAAVFPQVKELLRLCYDPDVLFHVVLDKVEGIGDMHLEDIYDQFIAAVTEAQTEMSSATNRSKLTAVIERGTPDVADLLVGIVNKDLKAGVGSKSILTCFPGLFVKFTVQLANKYDPKKLYDTKFWLASTKLDGLRCEVLRFEDGWRMFTREGSRIHTCQPIIDACELMYQKHGYTFWEGELYQSGITFEQIQSMVMSRTDPTAGRYLVLAAWCFGLAENFLEEKGDFGFFLEGDTFMGEVSSTTGNRLFPVMQVRIENKPEIIEVLRDRVVERGGEGIMLRNPKYTYDFKRSDLLLKAKKMATMDCRIVDVVAGKLTRKVADGGNEAYMGMKAVNVLQENGEYCEVGSGWSVQQRIDAYNDPDSFVGKTIEVQYQNLTNTGKCRFPVFKSFRLDKTVEG